jgi:hypothetical protein
MTTQTTNIEQSSAPSGSDLEFRGNARYRPIQLISTQRNGEYWEGIDIRRGGQVNLFYPVIKTDIPKDKLLQQLSTILTQSAPLKDTGYCTLRDAGLDKKERLFIIVDRPMGQPLYTLIRGKNHVSLDTALSLIIQLCELLNRAHECEIFTATINIHNTIVYQKSDGSYLLSLVDLALDRRPFSENLHSPPIDLTSHPHPSMTQEGDRRKYSIYLCCSLLHHLVFAVPPSSPVSQANHVWPALPTKGQRLDKRLESCLHTVLLKGLSVNPADRFPRIAALQKTLIGLRQLISLATPAFDLLNSTQRRLGQDQVLNLSSTRPAIQKAAEVRQKIHQILEDESGASLEDLLKQQ